MKTSLKILAFILFAFCGYLNAQDLFTYIDRGDYETVEKLIIKDPNLVDSIMIWDATPLMVASYIGNEEIVKLLIKHGADLNKVNSRDGLTALHIASLQNKLSVIEILISNGMDVNVKDLENKTALIYAIEKNNREIVEYLLKNNAKLPEENEIMNQVIHPAVLYGFQDLAGEIMKKGASLSSKDNNGRSLLHNAVIGMNIEWIDLLLRKNVDVNKVDSFSRAPLHYSVELNQLDITKSLIQNGAEININDCTNRTPLNIAQDLDHIQIAAFLESKGGIVSEPKIIKIENEGNKQSEIKVTYIANMGVLISSASKTVLIDGLFNNSFNTYPIPSPKIVSKINKLETPFNSIDLILVTHNHGDHFSWSMIAEYLSINKTVKVVCSNLASTELIECKNYNVDSSRIVGITPELCKSIDTIVNDINLKLLRLRHDGGDGQSENIGFLIDMDGLNIFHSGDSDGNIQDGLEVSGIQEYDSIGIKEMKVDLAILNRGWLGYSSSPGIEIIEKYLKPKHIFLAHFSENNKQGEWEWVDQTIKENEDTLPELTMFKWPMQNIIIQKGL